MQTSWLKSLMCAQSNMDLEETKRKEQNYYEANSNLDLGLRIDGGNASPGTNHHRLDF